MLTCAVFPLICIGSLVTTTESGMAVPDWPGTYGYNLFLYPLATWFNGPWDIFVEHGHRLFASLVGLITIALLVSTWVCQCNSTVKTAAAGALLLVLFQGALGGARVLLDARLLAILHASTAPVFFAYCACLAVLTSKWWAQATPAAGGNGFKRFSLLTLVLGYFQLVLGANLRHLGQDSPFRALVFFHVLMALVLLVHAFILAMTAGMQHADRPWAVWSSLLLVGLITVQIGLGAGAFFLNYSLPSLEQSIPAAAGYTIEANGDMQMSVVTLHVATGSLIVAWSAVIALRAWRLFRAENASTLAPGVAS
ncbi:COX15/CtaA family protein [Lignipirellula cremea]|uniref:COX15/CtaA family protein n=1 Tax=Lignipirellula cremea TaxID=2528010 RepID=UPI0011A42FAF|nr:COX15/CtaA family protein [Lignipirellula cremea]